MKRKKVLFSSCAEKRKTTAAMHAAAQLAYALTHYDQLYPGDPDADVRVSGKQWRAWMLLARRAMGK